jgi:hypothetical protein
MSAESLVRDALVKVPKAVAAGVVDMASGLLLSIKTVESHPQAVIDLLAAATRDLFEGEMVVAIENTFKKARGVTSGDHYFQEILVASTNLWHYFGRLKSMPGAVLVVVTAGDVNLGLLIVKCRELTGSGTI